MLQVQTLWREGDSGKMGEEEVRRVCSVLVSAEYCDEMTGRLEAKLKERSPPSLAPTISLTQEQDLFHAVLAQACDSSLSVQLILYYTFGLCFCRLVLFACVNSR